MVLRLGGTARLGLASIFTLKWRAAGQSDHWSQALGWEVCQALSTLEGEVLEEGGLVNVSWIFVYRVCLITDSSW